MWSTASISNGVAYVCNLGGMGRSTAYASDPAPWSASV